MVFILFISIYSIMHIHCIAYILFSLLDFLPISIIFKFYLHLQWKFHQGSELLIIKSVINVITFNYFLCHYN